MLNDCAHHAMTSSVDVVVGCWRHGSQFLRTDSPWSRRKGHFKVKLSNTWNQTHASRYH